MESVAIFADVQNIYYTTRQAFGRNFDYNALWAQATRNRLVSNAYAYAIERGDDKQRQFQNILRGIGFDVKLKPFLQRKDGSAKGDWDVGITIDVLDHASTVDIVVLLSGDGDFSDLVNVICKRHAIQVEVVGVPALTARSLQEAATRFIAIDDTLLMR